MKKKLLEKAIGLFDSIPGANLVENYINELYRDEIEELYRFIDKTIKDIHSSYNKNKSEEYVDRITKTYVAQLSISHQCKIAFEMIDEAGENMNNWGVDVSLKLRSYEKSTWIDKLVITGSGVNGGISIEELDEWDLLMKFILEKKKESAKFAPSNAKLITDKIDAIQQEIDLKDK